MTPDAILATLTAQIASAYVANHEVSPDNMPGLLRSIYQALSGITLPTQSPIDCLDVVQEDLGLG